jgi:purine-binding chemotaxis protein CheW
VEEDHTKLLLICRVAARLCALPVELVVETMRPLGVEPVAGAPPFVQGIARIRGALLPVVDAARLLGMPEAHAGRFVTVRVGLRCVALAVSSVLGLRSVAADALQAWPPLLRDAEAGAVETIGLLDEDLLSVLAGAKVLPEVDWSPAGAAEAAG